MAIVIMKKYKKLFQTLLMPLLILSFAAVGPFIVNDYASADRAQDFCNEQFPVTNSTSAGENAACVNAARAEEAECFRTNGTGSTGVQCVENYYNGLRGTSTPSNSTVTPVDDTPISTDCNETPLTKENCGIISLIVAVINVLSALAGIAIIASIVLAGYQYMTAQDNSGKIQQARQRIIWALSALGLLIFMYAFLNWLVPGGVL